jgi:hypothetical protein
MKTNKPMKDLFLPDEGQVQEKIAEASAHYLSADTAS